MKGIILAGGSGTRLYPATQVVSKQLLPVGDKPMIYYPLSTLMLAGLTEILIISTPNDLPNFERLLGDGSRFGIRLEYAVQPTPDGLAQAFLIGRDFLDGDSACLILGDNIFYADGLAARIRKWTSIKDGAVVFGYHVKDPQRYGVIEFGEDDTVLSIEEKPKTPKSAWAAVGLYFYDRNVCDYAAQIKPSWRNELEITDLNNLYLQHGKLFGVRFGRGTAWLDTGTHESLLKASLFVSTVEELQDVKIACLEEIAFNNGLIGREDLARQAAAYGSSPYGQYLKRLANHVDQP